MGRACPRLLVIERVFAAKAAPTWAQAPDLDSRSRRSDKSYSTVTLFAKFLGLSTSVPRAVAV